MSWSGENATSAASTEPKACGRIRRPSAHARTTAEPARDGPREGRTGRSAARGYAATPPRAAGWSGLVRDVDLRLVELAVPGRPQRAVTQHPVDGQHGDFREPPRRREPRLPADDARDDGENEQEGEQQPLGARSDRRIERRPSTLGTPGEQRVRSGPPPRPTRSRTPSTARPPPTARASPRPSSSSSRPEIASRVGEDCVGWRDGGPHERYVAAGEAGRDNASTHVWPARRKDYRDGAVTGVSFR